ncbi:MAG: 2Fe-2S iron-sulfur cluster-binding protein, partial [Melioribacteraceae bacterium]|nr:2Fe-2S iron-sulfur cluster-binding protein [Melioribacteraceae bacterium]
MGDHNINLTLHIWRQESNNSKGDFEIFKVSVSPDASILEMLDELNNGLEKEGKIPIAFESDCREGICGTCGVVINGHPHGKKKKTATCQVHMRTFNDGDTIYIEPFRAKAFKVIKDLVVDRSGFDIIQQAGGYVSFNTGSAPDA